MKYQKGFAPVLLLIIAVFAVSAGGYVVYKNKTETVKKDMVVSSDSADIQTTTEVMQGSSESENIKVNISAPVTTTVNCGSKECFSSHFASCTANSTINSDAGFAAFFAKIIGPATGGCKVTMKYTSNPNPDWVNKEMTCVMNNKIEIEASIQETFSGIMDGSITCEGPLYELLKSY